MIKMDQSLLNILMVQVQSISVTDMQALAAEGHLLNERLNAQYTNKQIPQNYLTKEEKAATGRNVQNIIKLK